MVKKIQAEIENLYEKAVSTNGNKLAFLQALYAYISYVKSEPILTKLVKFLEEEQAHEAILDIRKSLADPIYKQIVEARDQTEDEPRFFPFHDYQYLEEGMEDFALWKSIKTEEELVAQKAEIKKRI